MRTVIGAVVAIVAGLAFAGAGTFVLVNSLAPDRAVEFRNAPEANNANGVVNYGTP
ncbi:hypothetical protein [Umezawaea sp.]|uniref:hypothetical protein n=1 Tax=Umezawaea sp. TaxID=1955258 RepID=UPI002ED0B2D6